MPEVEHPKLEHPKKRPLWDLATGKCLQVFAVDLREIVKVNPGRYSVTEPTQAQLDEFKRNNPDWKEAERPAEKEPLQARDDPLVDVSARIASAEWNHKEHPENPAYASKLAALLFERGGDGDHDRAHELLESLRPAPAPDPAAEAAARQEKIVAALRKLDPMRDFKDGKIADMRKLKARLSFNPSDEEIEAALEALTGEAAE